MDEHTLETQKTTCCVVGAGPAGMMLALLLARAGVRVTLLEAHKDFDRDFRGDTIHSSTLEVLDQLGLADRLHDLPHAKIRDLRLVSRAGTHAIAVFSRLPTRFPYIMMMPQSRFLTFLADAAKQYPHFTLVMNASVQQLVEEEGVVRGVRYQSPGGRVEIRATLTVAADGRFSRIRKLAGLEPVPQSPPMDVLWFRLPRTPEDRHDAATVNVDRGHVVVLMAREHEWQVGYVLPTGGYQRIKVQGVATLQQSVAACVPWLADRVGLLNDWRHMNVLSVEANRLTRWYRSGLLIIGDAAHSMLPVGAVGINCAIADAVEAANVLAQPLRAGRVQDNQLAEVQRRRERLTRIIQHFQAVMQKRITNRALASGKPFTPPLALRAVLRVPGLRNLPARIMAFGVRRVRLERPQEIAAE
jgi:2-polyprenyl-6-methoxyphenol hydroxylase-like FAD-dependent oxidoreductase